MTAELTTCPLCEIGSPRKTDRTHPDRGTTYALYMCDACGIWFWSPLKNPGPAWYSSHESYSVRNADPVWNATWNHRTVLSTLKERRGSVLDVGCGIGNFLALAKEKGWQASGIDFDPDAIESARMTTGLPTLETSDLISYAKKYPEKKFDLITFFDVFEHLDNHNEFLSTVRSMLRDGGHIALSMPYRKHARWLMKGDLPPGHLTHWDRTTLRTYLDRQGFDIIRLERNTDGLWSIVMKMRFKYGTYFSFGAVNAVRKSVGDVVAKPGGRPFSVRLVHTLAKMKDAILFGIPATIIYVCMMPFPQRYIDLFAIARKRSG